MMWKLTFNLCALIFVTLVIAGRDKSDVIAAIPGMTTAQNSVLDLVAPTLVAPSKVAAVERVAFAPDAAAEQEQASNFWQVIGTRINVRGGPSTKGDVLAKLGKGEEVLIVEDNGKGWVKIRIEGDGIEGWVASSLLVPAE